MIKISNWLLIIGVIIAIVIVFAAVYGNSSNIGSEKLNHYSKNGISFNYPDGWNISKGDKSKNEILSAKKVLKENNVTVDKSTLSIWTRSTNKQNLTTYLMVIKAGALPEGRKITSERNVTVNGNKGYEIVIEDQDGQSMIVFFKKDGKYYNIGFSAKTLQRFKEDIDVVVNSFNVTK